MNKLCGKDIDSFIPDFPALSVGCVSVKNEYTHTYIIINYNKDTAILDFDGGKVNCRALDTNYIKKEYHKNIFCELDNSSIKARVFYLFAMGKLKSSNNNGPSYDFEATELIEIDKEGNQVTGADGMTCSTFAWAALKHYGRNGINLINLDGWEKRYWDKVWIKRCARLWTFPKEDIKRWLKKSDCIRVRPEDLAAASSFYFKEKKAAKYHDIEAPSHQIGLHLGGYIAFKEKKHFRIKLFYFKTKRMIFFLIRKILFKG